MTELSRLPAPKLQRQRPSFSAAVLLLVIGLVSLFTLAKNGPYCTHSNARASVSKTIKLAEWCRKAEGERTAPRVEPEAIPALCEAAQTPRLPDRIFHPQAPILRLTLLRSPPR